jgi:hypothetical protein
MGVVPRRGLRHPSAIKDLACSGKPDRPARFRGFTWRSFPLAPCLTPRGARRDRARCRQITRGFPSPSIPSDDAEPDSVGGSPRSTDFRINLGAIFGASSAAAQAQVEKVGPRLAREHRTAANDQSHGPAARGAGGRLARRRRQGRSSLVLAADLRRVYPLLCQSWGWQPFTWNTLARDLREMTGGRKWCVWHAGKRLRAYPVPRQFA